MRSRRLVVCIIATNVAPRELLWRPNICARWAVDHSFLQLYRSDATALRTHAWRRNRSFRQCSIQLIEKASVTNFIGKSIPRPDRFLSRDRRKGFNYGGTIIVDLERRIVADVLETRSAKETADWVKQHPEIEVVSRDRCGLYAQGVRQGAPQARQVADRFHLLQNLRESIERHMTRVSRFAGSPQLPPIAGDCHAAWRGERDQARQALFDPVKLLRASGKLLSTSPRSSASTTERSRNGPRQVSHYTVGACR